MIFRKPLLAGIAASAVFIAGFSVTAEEKAAESAPTTLTNDTLMQLKSMRDAQISPDGKWIAYVVSRKDEKKDRIFSQIFMTSTDGETTIPLTAEYTNASRPRWNPDGSSIAFMGVRGKGDDLKSQVWLLDRRGGEAQQYTDVKQGVGSYVWSPDGSRMVLTITDEEPEVKNQFGEKPKSVPYVIDRLQFKADYVGYLNRLRDHLYLFDGEGDPVQITSGDYDDSDPVWSPDGSKIAFVSNRYEDPDANINSDIWVVSADAEAKEFPLTQVTKNLGSDDSPTWSPDGKSIAYVTNRELEKLWYDVTNLAITSSAGGGEEKLLTADFDYHVYSPEFSKNGKSIYFMTPYQGNTPIAKANAKSGKVTIVTEGEVSAGGFSFSAKGKMAYLQSSHDYPRDLFVMNKGKPKRLTTLNADVLDGLNLSRVERLKVAGWQGNMVESFVYYPHDYDASKAYPTIFILHGGPVSQHNTSFDNWGQLFSSAGYVTVLPNPHGSNGYGEAFSYALNAQWGTPDFADVDAIADYLVEKGISDGDKLGVGGWSYGGILTNYVITKSTRFAGAVSGASEVNHRANYGHDIYQHWWETELGLPWENIEAWESMNPFNDLGKVTTPTLVIGGQVDWNVPIQNSEQLYQVLRRRGIDTQLVVYPNEHHGIRRPSFQRDRNDRFMGWFDKYVKGTEAEEK